MNKKKVLHIIPNFGLGGAERLLMNLLEAFDYKRFEVAAVSLYPESGTILEKKIREKCYKVYFLNKHRGPDLRMIPRLYRVMKDFRPDVVHTHRYVLRYTLLATLFYRVPVQIHTVHNIAQKEVEWMGKVFHWFAFRLGAVVPVSISQEVANTIKALYGCNIYTPVIYNGIPTCYFIDKRFQDDTEKKDIILLHIGRFQPQKNHLLLIKAYEIAKKEYPSISLWLVGDGPLRGRVEKLVKEKGFERNVKFLGVREDVAKLLSEADVFILPSDWEGVPLSILEAMAASKPVIATSVGGVPELVENGVSGILVPPGNPEALAKAILHLANDPDLRQRMGKAGQKIAIERFDISRTAREYEALYLELLRGRK